MRGGGGVGDVGGGMTTPFAIQLKRDNQLRDFQKIAQLLTKRMCSE